MMIKSSQAQNDDVSGILAVFDACFTGDGFYQKAAKKRNLEIGALLESFHDEIAFCAGSGFSYAARETFGQVVGYVLAIDYTRTRSEHPEMFEKIFSTCGKPLMDRLDAMGGNVLFVTSLAVLPDYRRHYMGSGLLDLLAINHPEYAIAGDVSNPDAVPVCESEGFASEKLAKDYFFVHKPPRA